MGCKQSTPVGEKPHLSLGKSERMISKTRQGAMVGKTERQMSYAQRKSKSAEDVVGQEKRPPSLNSNGQLMPEEVVRRTSSSVTVSEIVLGGQKGNGNTIRAKYAYWTQRGYYPDDPHKANQDAYSVTNKFASQDGDTLFAVYDGHGTHGHDCALFAKKALPNAIAKHVRQKRARLYQNELKKAGEPIKGLYNPTKWPKLSAAEFEAAARKGFIECNEKMHDDKRVDDRISGTTAIAAAFHFGRLTVCNVGDSRAIMGRRVPGTRNSSSEEEKSEIEGDDAYSGMPSDKGGLVAFPLSQDQIPYRRDERKRIIKAGAQVMTMDEKNGNEPQANRDLDLGKDIDLDGDPPRVWVKGKEYPGCAFTRSLGDRLADDIGVFAEPEMLSTEVSASDEILVIASDGIFEFLTNQAVIDICAQCYSPIEACEKVVRASYQQWLIHENRTDDITLIVCFLKCSDGANSAPLRRKRVVENGSGPHHVINVRVPEDIDNDPFEDEKKDGEDEA